MRPEAYKNRTYRNLIPTDTLPFFKVVVKETDLFVHAPAHLEPAARELILQGRKYIEDYITQYPEFARTLQPWHVSRLDPMIVRDMAEASQKAGVGPMAAVAGAIAEYVGKGLLCHTDEVIVENGGDIFLKKDTPLTIAIFAGESPLSLRVGLRICPGNYPLAVCTSSGTVGHSVSFGKADAVCVVSDSCPIADAAATAMGNHVRTKADIRKAIEFGKKIQGIIGAVVIKGDKIGAWGELEVVPLRGKKG